MSEFNDEEVAVPEQISDELTAMFDLKQKKKKKKKKVIEDETPSISLTIGDGGGGGGGSLNQEINNENSNLNNEGEGVGGGGSKEGVTSQEFILDPATYSYNILLQRAVELLHQHNPEYSEKRRKTMKPPQLMRGSLFPSFFLSSSCFSYYLF